MKKSIIIIASLCFITIVNAQYNTNQNNNRQYDGRDNNRNYNTSSVLTVTVNGNSNEQVLIDGQNYTSSNNGNNAIQITNLQSGQHTLQVINNSGGKGILGAIFGGGNNTGTSTAFNLRSGYDMQISVNANGRARIRETRSANYQNRNNSYNRGRNNNQGNDAYGNGRNNNYGNNQVDNYGNNNYGNNQGNNNGGYNNNNGGYNNYNTPSILTVTLNGNSNEQVLIDGQNYTPSNNGNNAIQITNLQPGQHTLQVTSNSGGRGILGAIFGGRNNTASTSFNLRRGYDMQISINANGRARIRETRSGNYQNNTYNR
jgi:hypothetical protein